MDAQPQKKGFIARHWKWLVPVGCVSVIAILLAAAAAIVFFVFGAIKSSDVYNTALAAARSSPAVARELGEPIEAGWFVSGSIEVNDGSGNADLKIPISGPRKEGTIYAVATRTAGRWVYSTLEIEIEGQSERIDLLSQNGN